MSLAIAVLIALQNLRSLAVALALMVAGCGGLDPAEEVDHDGADDSFQIDGKADTGGIAEGTPEAKAVLVVASKASEAQLTSADGANLYSKAAAAILLHRKMSGHPFASLAELDAVPYVGPVALWKLLEYADRTGKLAATGKIYTEGEPLHFGDASYVLAGGLLLKQRQLVTLSAVTTTVVWQLKLSADHLAFDAVQKRLVAFGPDRLYLVSTSGLVEKSFDEGYADVPQLGGTLTAGLCATYQNLGSYYRGRSLASFMVGNLYLGYAYQFWAATFEGFVELYC